MHSYTLSSLRDTRFLITVDGDLILPADIRDAIDFFWRDLSARGSGFYRGSLFVLTHVEHDGDVLRLRVRRSDFAHYLYEIAHGLPEAYSCSNLHTSVVVLTCDGWFVFGQQNGHTAHPFRVMFSGGGVDERCEVDGVLDPSINAREELFEEIGVCVDDTAHVRSFSCEYIKRGGRRNEVGFVYRACLALHRDACEALFRSHVRGKPHGSCEFSDLFFVRATPRAVSSFLAACHNKTPFAGVVLERFMHDFL